ncbi:MAG: hypothetical protein IJU39_06570 [Clostridia bacterium]|nr:hypothetical protein [Clostridia bacterium]
MKIKRIISLILCMPLVLMTGAVSFAAEKSAARLYNVYGDDMLFKQNEDAVLAGKANAGSTVKAELFDENGTLVTSGETLTPDSGVFEVSFKAPSGGFREYSVVLSENNTVFATLTGVVFGELWLASGQSNMEYALRDELTVEEVRQNGYASPWIRALMVGRLPWSEDENTYTLYELDETPTESKWIKADDPEIESVSAVGYFFAQKLEKEIGMPVGIIHANRGGSVISSWISRQTIESDPQMLEVLKRRHQYFTVEQYLNATEQQRLEIKATNMSSSYNEQIYPIRSFRLSGMLWYQGESDDDIGYSVLSRGEYTHMFNILQDEMSRTFSYDGDLPIVLSDLAIYGPYATPVNVFNDEFASMQTLKPESRAVVTNYDIFPSYNPDNQPIHPNSKVLVGERMALVGEALVYGNGDIFSAPYIKSFEIDGSNVLVTLSNVGDGLAVKGDKLYDFTVCGEDGVYYKADAEIVSKDTVRISSDQVKKPVAATYALSTVNLRANLYATKDGERVMPVSPFATDIKLSDHFYWDSPYMDMEQGEMWNPGFDFLPIWDARECEYTIAPDSAFDGQVGMCLVSGSKTFSLYKRFRNDLYSYENANYNWNGYKALRLQVRNTGSHPVTIESLKLGTGNKVWFTPSVNGTAFKSAVIPADGKWHTVEYDLTNLYRSGVKLLKYDNSELSAVHDVRFDFSSKVEGSSLDIDEIEFGSSVESGQSKRPVSLIVRIVKLIKRTVESIKNLFTK